MAHAAGCGSGNASLLIAALAFAKGDFHAPRFVLRVVEANRDPSSMPRLKGELGEYVRQAVFTSGPLFELIRRHGLYPKLMRQNSRAALDSFREDRRHRDLPKLFHRGSRPWRAPALGALGGELPLQGSGGGARRHSRSR